MTTAPLVCQICKESKSPHNGMIAELIRPSFLEFIKKKMPDLDSNAFICFEDLGEFRKDYVKEVLEDERRAFRAGPGSRRKLGTA